MATSNSILLLCLWLFVLIVIIVSALGGNNFYQDFDILWGNDKVKVLNNEELVTLSLDMSSGSGFQSKNEYLFGKIDMQLKLVPGNSAGTVTSYYLSSKGPAWDEIDFEFLGNLSGDPYTLHTNVITQGKADREQQFRLWFDPTLDFHNYSILWNPLTIVFYVDGSPIREFKNLNSKGIAFPKNQAMRLYFSLWNGDGWATRGGLIKIDWTKAPFTASLRNFNGINGCVWSNSDNRHHHQHASSCDVNDKWMKQDLNEASLDRLKWVQKNHMIYTYCTDTERFPQGPPPECSFTRN